jgi:hypothetical protein
MSRMYAVVFEGVSVTAGQDFFEIAPADDKPVLIHALFLDQISDVGDAQEEMLRYQVIRGHSTSGSGGTAPTPRAISNNNTTAAGFAAEVNNTTIASAGTPLTLHAGAFNIRTGLAIILTPEMRWGCSQPSSRIVVRLMAAPSDAVTISGTLYVEEVF